MPAYGSLLNPPALYQGDSYLAFNAEAVVTGEFSQQIALPVNQPSGSKGIRVVIDFSAAPGAFEIDVMESDADQEGSAGYTQVPTGGSLTNAGLTAGPNGAGTRVTTDLIPVAGQMCCLYVKTQPANAVTCKARVTRSV
jgi:hypothetical protein